MLQMKGVLVVLLVLTTYMALGVASPTPTPNPNELLYVCTTASPSFCASLYQQPPCGLAVKVTTLGFTVFEEPFDLAVSNKLCAPTFNGCTYCVELRDLTPHKDGDIHPCMYLQNSCATADTFLGCVNNTAIPASCLSQGCPNGCSNHGDCLSTGKCQCDNGYYGDDCSDQAPLFNDCVDFGAPYGSVCLKLETEECAIDASIYFAIAPSTPIYNQLISAPAFNTYFQESTCFGITPNCKACLSWVDFTLNETYAHGCPVINTTCTGLPAGKWAFDCFEDDALFAACFGTCPEGCNDNGVCEDGHCECDVQWDGPVCDIPKCDKLYNCYGNGECIAPNMCKCNDGYSGANCAAATCDGVAGCSSHGRCIAPNKCQCTDDYTGADCAKKATSGGSGEDKKHTPSAAYVIVGVVVGLVVAAAGGAGAFFVWKWRRSQRVGRVFTAFDDGLMRVPDTDDTDDTDSQ